MTKEEKIKEAYKEIQAKNLYPRKDGYAVINHNSEFDPEKVIIKSELCTDIRENDSIRKILIPKSLLGIENNNGWIKVESEKDFPTEDIMYRSGFFKEEGEFYQDSNLFNLKTTLEALTVNHYTHWQPAPKPTSPLY